MGKAVTIRLEVEEVEHVLEGLRVWRERWELTRLHHERGWCTEGELLCDCADARTASLMEAYLRELEEKIGRGMGGG